MHVRRTWLLKLHFCRHHYRFRDNNSFTGREVVILHNQNTIQWTFMHTIGKRFKRKFPPKNYHALFLLTNLCVFVRKLFEIPCYLLLDFMSGLWSVYEFSVDNLLPSSRFFMFSLHCLQKPILCLHSHLSE